MRTTIGVEEIDALIEGGVPRGAAVLVAGETGTGKSVLCLEFILAGIREGEPGVYVTADEPGRILETASALGWDLRGAVEDGYARVVQVLPPNTPVAAAPASMPMAAAGAPGGGAPGAPSGGAPEAPAAPAVAPSNGSSAVASGPAAATVEAVAEAVREIQAERVVIDPALAPGAAGELAVAFVADLLRGTLEQTHCTTLITGLRLHGGAGYTRLGIEEQLVDGIVDLAVRERDGRRTRVLSVRAMHGTKIDLDDHPFTISGRRGIVLGEG